MEIDWTQVLIAVIVVVLPSVLRELRNFYNDWRVQQPAIAYELERAAEMGVKAAEVWKRNNEKGGEEAEAYAVEAAQKVLNRAGIRIDAALIFDAVKAAWLEYSEQPKG